MRTTVEQPCGTHGARSEVELAQTATTGEQAAPTPQKTGREPAESHVHEGLVRRMLGPDRIVVRALDHREQLIHACDEACMGGR